MQTILLQKNREDGYHIYNIPGVAVTKKGTVLCYYECRHGGDWSVTDIALCRSENGRDFSKRQIIVSGKNHNTVHSFMVFVKQEELYALWCENYHRIYLIKSTNDGISWSAPTEITYVFENYRKNYNWQVLCIGPGHGLVTKSGRLMCGVWLAGNKADRNKHFPSVMTTLYSDDGKNWHLGEVLPSTESFLNPSENLLAQMADGSIYMNFRHEGPSRLRGTTVSLNGFTEWREYAVDESLPDPVCAAGLTSAKGEYLFTNCAYNGTDKRDARINLTLKRSNDLKTWSKGLLIDEQGGYSDVEYNPINDKIYVIYNGGRLPEATDWFHYEGIKITIIGWEELC